MSLLCLHGLFLFSNSLRGQCCMKEFSFLDFFFQILQKFQKNLGVAWQGRELAVFRKNEERVLSWGKLEGERQTAEEVLGLQEGRIASF